MRILNLYAGIGGNRKMWPDHHTVTAIEYDQKIADIYQDQNPFDEVIVSTDAHKFLLENYQDFDFIWSSPPCQSHSRMIRSGQNRKPRFPDMRLYEEIIFLKYSAPDVLWVVENVVPYYKPLVEPSTKVGRHLFWSNFEITAEDVKRPTGFINLGNKAGAEKLKRWLGIDYEGVVYYDGNHCPAQILRNAVHPKIGLHILNDAQKGQ
jgi:DNA (cytosine-5)-methyltransferase 1